MAMSKSTYSRASVDGLLPFRWPDGQGQHGQDRVHANPLALPGDGAVHQTIGTFGRKCSVLSASAGLQQSLASRLRVLLGDHGSPEYSLTWKSWDMPSRVPICALRASARRTYGSGCTGWPTPTTGWRGNETADRKASRGSGGVDLQTAAATVRGWATPASRDWKDTAGMATAATNPDGSHRHRVDQLPRQAGTIAGSCDASSPPGTEARGKSGGGLPLNPRFSLWLMGYPDEWACCGDVAMRSFRKLRRRS